eukprot:3004885-Alexandrium_andersonii.AAC.1
MLQFSLVSAPSAPEPGKWTNIGPSLDGLLFVQLQHRFYGTLFAAAFSNLVVQLVPLPGPNPVETDMIEWHELAGRRAKAAI